MNYELTNRCVTEISNYLGFPASTLLEAGDYLTIFGGAVRDSLAGKEIHDIDIMSLPKSAHLLSKKLEELNFKRVDLYDRVELELYKDIHLISEPWTFVDGKRIIQIIRPTAGLHGKDSITLGTYLDALYSLLSDVDISACGVFLERDKDAIIRLKESHPSAISHCRSLVFRRLRNNRMFGEERTRYRSMKLEERGWKDLTNNQNLKDERKIKLNGLDDLQKPEYDYKFYNKKPNENNDLEKSFYGRAAHLI